MGYTSTGVSVSKIYFVLRQTLYGSQNITVGKHGSLFSLPLPPPRGCQASPGFPLCPSTQMNATVVFFFSQYKHSENTILTFPGAHSVPSSGGPFLVLQKYGLSGWLHHNCLHGSKVRNWNAEHLWDETQHEIINTSQIRIQPTQSIHLTHTATDKYSIFRKKRAKVSSGRKGQRLFPASPSPHLVRRGKETPRSGRKMRLFPLLPWDHYHKSVSCGPCCHPLDHSTKWPRWLGFTQKSLSPLYRSV